MLLDVDMPGMDGFAVCRRLRAEPRFATVPIVMVTGHEDSEAIRLAFEAGATDFISKPVNWALLPRRLEYILRNAAAAERIERLAYFDTLDRAAQPATLHRDGRADVRRSGGARTSRSPSSTWISTASSASTTPSATSVGRCRAANRRRQAHRALESFKGALQHVTVGRFGGDEFVILVRHRDARALAIRIAEKCGDGIQGAHRPRRPRVLLRAEHRARRLSR